MKQGDTILIIPSQSLIDLKLEELAGYAATVVQINSTADNIKGCWVKLPIPYMEEYEWYIPYNSISV